MVECIENNPKSEHYRLGFTPTSRLGISLGGMFVVYAMCLWQSVLMLLIVDETGSPVWCPAGLFRVRSGAIPTCWGFAQGGCGDDVEALWGYPELVEDVDEFDRLSEMDHAAVARFMRAKGLIDGEMNAFA